MALNMFPCPVVCYIVMALNNFPCPVGRCFVLALRFCRQSVTYKAMESFVVCRCFLNGLVLTNPHSPCWFQISGVSDCYLALLTIHSVTDINMQQWLNF